jgi:multiple antibiotic resistance protein
VTDFAINTIVMFLVVLNPIGLAPVFATLTARHEPARRKQMACKAVALAGAILLIFALGGNLILRALGVGLPALRVAGGALLFLLAVEMVFARQSGVRSTTDRERREAEEKEDISVFPLAFPLIAGPGAITTVTLLSFELRGQPGMFAVALAIMAVMLFATLASLLTAGPIVRVMGVTGANVIGRLLGLLLASLAAQYVIDGVREAFL